MDAQVASAPVKVSSRATEVAHAWLRSPLYRELELEAERRGEHVDQLAGKLLTGIIVLGCIDEVLSSAEKLLDV